MVRVLLRHTGISQGVMLPWSDGAKKGRPSRAGPSLLYSLIANSTTPSAPAAMEYLGYTTTGTPSSRI